MPEASSGPAPFYASPSSFKTLIATLKTNGLPGRVDRHVLSSFSNAVGTQIITGLKFLGLVSDTREPTNLLASLVASYDTDEWPVQMRRVLEYAYRPLFELNFAVATPGQFNDTFKKHFNGEGDTLRKATSFFLAMAAEANIELSRYLTSTKKARGGNGPKKRLGKPSQRKGDHREPDSLNDENLLGGSKKDQKPSEMLLSHLKDMDSETQEAAWVLMKHFTAKNL